MLHCWGGGWGSTKICKGMQSGQLTPSNQRDFPYCILICSEVKHWGEENGGGDVLSDGICLPNHHCVWWSPASLEMAEPLPMGSGEWTSFLTLTAFALPIKLALGVFSVLILYLIIFLSHCGEERWVTVWLCGLQVLSGIKPQHLSTKSGVIYLLLQQNSKKWWW